MDSADKTLQDLIKKLKQLEQLAPYLRRVGFREKIEFRSKDAQDIVEEIDLDLAWVCKQAIAPYIEYEDEYSFLNDLGLIGTFFGEPTIYDGIRWALTKSGKSHNIHTVIQLVKKALFNAERESEQPPKKPPVDGSPVSPPEHEKSDDGGGGEIKGGQPNEKEQTKSTPAENRAWKSFCWVCSKYPELVPPPNKKGKQYTEEMYKKALEESGEYQDDEGNWIAEPGFGSWKRNINGYMNKQPKESSQNQEVIREPNSDQVDKLTEISNRYTPRAD